MASDSNVFLACFLSFFVARYLRTVVSIFTYLAFKPKRIVEKPKYGAENTTVVIPTTFKTPHDLVQCLQSIISCSPAAIIIVTSHANVPSVKLCLSFHSLWNIRVLGVDRLHKRIQMMRALEDVTTDITVFADDDVFWPQNYLNYLLALFEDPKVGAGGTRQRVRRETESISWWNFLGVCYLERRVWNNVCTNAIDGSISTLSGRTAAYRSKILQTSEFRQYFLEDSWAGKKLNSDDDKCLTRYVYANGWNIGIQFDPRSVIETNLEDGPKYINQCLRWARAHWRGNFTVMRQERYWCSFKFCWGLYVIYLGQFQTPALLVDGALLSLLWGATDGKHYQVLAMVAMGMWILFTKLVKIMPHLYRHPQDLKFIPFSLVFSYLHGFINLYALFTLHVTTWGSQNLQQLEAPKAQNGEVAPTVKHGHENADEFWRIMFREDYFSAKPSQPKWKWVLGISS